jgi:uracil DNA glycosylase
MSVYIDDIKIEEKWKEILKDEFKKDCFIQIKDFLLKEKQQ